MLIYTVRLFGCDGRSSGRNSAQSLPTADNGGVNILLLPAKCFCSLLYLVQLSAQGYGSASCCCLLLLLPAVVLRLTAGIDGVTHPAVVSYCSWNCCLLIPLPVAFAFWGTYGANGGGGAAAAYCFGGCLLLPLRCYSCCSVCQPPPQTK